MQDFIFKFEFEDPEAARLNEGSDNPEYLTSYFKIRATDMTHAEAWGRTLADWLVMRLFGDEQPGRWAQTIGVGRTWDRLPEFRPPVLDKIWASRAIMYGEYPQLEAVRKLMNLSAL